VSVLIEDRLGGLDQAVPAQRRPGPASSAAKRVFDVALALALLCFFSPLLLAIALAVRLDSPGPALFRQRRTGLNGRPFQILKFRTMTVMEDGALTAVSRGDPRVTRIGAVLRRTSLDELPQLLNVVLSEMSLVGPRPHALAHDERFAQEAPDYALRFAARPGVTGLAQISGFRGEIVSREGLAGRVDADLRYIRGWTLLLDLRILLSTARMVWADDKAY
jgi:putative colanic acid biosynthesis UDP-glucose lipid carrier transferase